MNTDIYQNQEIHEVKKELSGKVSWVIFGLYITVCLTIFGWVITNIIRTQDKVDTANERVSSVEGDIKAIKQDTSWIKESLKELNNKK